MASRASYDATPIERCMHPLLPGAYSRPIVLHVDGAMVSQRPHMTFHVPRRFPAKNEPRTTHKTHYLERQWGL